MKFKKRYYLILFFLCLHTIPMFAQINNASLIQFSGVVVSDDSLKPIPFSTITNCNAKKTIITDIYGFFSFVAQKGDAIEFSAMGFKKLTLKYLTH